MKKLVNRFIIRLYKFSWVKQRWGANFNSFQVSGDPFAPAPKNLKDIHLAVVSTAGTHHIDDHPFDMENLDGDASFRTFSVKSPQSDLMITHNYYDHSSARKDINVVLPLSAIQKAIKEKKIKSTSADVYSFMGHIQNKPLEELIINSIPQLIKRLKADKVTAVLVSPA
ncbi:MAG: glycine/sarcosine/betaine reductase selenoprotein B family protein [SAR324 cluster bacterium]|nr:glycine/sarcosine/betaine reductase selenoprotein B family protein [SAR324 cluster bacterium]